MVSPFFTNMMVMFIYFLFTKKGEIQMESISSVVICLETVKEDVEINVGENEVTSLKFMKTASGIEILVDGPEGELIQGWPWSSIQSYSIQK